MSTTDNTNLSLDDLKAVVHKVKEESRREGYTDGAYDAIMAFCRAIGIPAIHVSRPSLWATPIDRVRTLEEYTDELGIEALGELREIIADQIEGIADVTLDNLWDNDSPTDVSPIVMPLCDIDRQALEAHAAKEESSNG